MEFIVDADIMRAAGLTENPVSSNARKLLIAIRDGNHSVSCCAELKEEWDKHSSIYAKRWRNRMIASRRYNYVSIDNATKIALEEKSESNEKKAAIKDSHLIDLAIKADKIIFSNDNKAKLAFSILLDNKFKIIYWMSSTNDFEHICKYPLNNRKTPKKYKI